MSKIDELIQQLCLDGVALKRLSSIAEIGTGSSNGNEAVDNGAYPFFIRSLNVKSKDAYEYDEEAIIIPGEGGIGEIFHYVNGKYALHQRVYRIHITDTSIDTKFVYHYMKEHFKSFIMKRAVNATVTSIRKPMIEDFVIPVIPLEIQRKIVRILDYFTELTAKLTAKLTAELTARKTQYEYYRERVLSFSNDTIKLSSIAEIGTGSSNGNEAVDNGAYPFFIRSQNVKSKDAYEYDEEAIIIPGEGGIGEIFHYVNGKYALHQRVYRIHITNTSIDTKFVYHYMKEHFKSFIMKRAVNATVTSIRKPMIEDFVIPLIPLEVQRKIANALDRFESLCNDIFSGIPAEIEARQKQYEYYRDKLLTFKEL